MYGDVSLEENFYNFKEEIMKKLLVLLMALLMIVGCTNAADEPKKGRSKN